MARVYDWYRQVKLEWLNAEEGTSPPTDDTLLGFAELMVAVVDGLAIQRSLDDDFDLKRPYALLEQILRRCLPELLANAPGQESTLRTGLNATASNVQSGSSRSR
jgi:hypothetical protein